MVILGVRSSVFLPFKNLNLIIVDEEHENTYKQYDPSPRYNARDTAIMLARFHGAKTLLGTATPALETWFNAKTGKYGLVELNERYQNLLLPEMIVADIKEAKKRKQMKSLFTPVMLEHIENTLKNQEQVILFQNRRGFSPYLECKACGWIPYCKNCDVSLTYHRHLNKLVCHYCGYSHPNPPGCMACGSIGMETGDLVLKKLRMKLLYFFRRQKLQEWMLIQPEQKMHTKKLSASSNNVKLTSSLAHR